MMEIRNFEELCMNCEIIGKNNGECCSYCFITTLKNNGYKIENSFEITKTKVLAKTIFKGNDGNIYFWYYEKGNGNIIFKNIREEIENLGYFDQNSLYIDSEFIKYNENDDIPEINKLFVLK